MVTSTMTSDELGRMIHDPEIPDILADILTMTGPHCYNGRHPLGKMDFAASPDEIGQCRQCGEPITQTFGSWLSRTAAP
jgi:hypothetical protein